MKRMNLKKEYEIKEMNQNQIEEIMNQNPNLSLGNFEDEDDYKMMREGKKNLYIIHIISEEKEKKERRNLDRDIKIDSKKIGIYGIKLIYHRDKNSEKEYRIFLSWKDFEGKLIRKRMRNSEIDSISRDEEKMIEYYQKIRDEKEIKKNIG